MSKLEELIQQYCPDGVEYVKIGEIAQVGTGSSNGNEAIEDGIYPFFVRSQIIKKKDTYEYDEEAIIIPGEGGIGDIFHYINGKYALHQRVYRIHFISPHINVKFAFYYMKSAFKKFIMAKAVSSTVSSIRKPMIEGFSLPIPPLPVQEEIVRILDNFTELQAELQAELQKRKLQYNYYLDNLLSFNRGEQTEVKWMKLKDVATQWYRGAGIKREEVSEDGMPCIRYGEIHTTYNIWFDDCISHTDESKQASRKYAEKGDILFAITSEDIPLVGNSVAYLGNERIMVGGDIVVMKHNQDPKYMAYALSTSDAIKQKGKGKVKSKVVHTNVPSLQEIVIPIPSMTEQKRIASILDRFDTLTNDLTQGLPAEIEKRRQQYEYYRDKLLTFKRKEA